MKARAEVISKPDSLKNDPPATSSTGKPHEGKQKPLVESAPVQHEPLQPKESACSGGTDPFAGKRPFVFHRMLTSLSDAFLYRSIY